MPLRGTRPAKAGAYRDRTSKLDLFKLRCEVPKHGWGFEDPEAAEFMTMCEHFRDSFDDVVDMALGVDAPRNGQAN
jgi:hypothetical protein